MFDGNKLKALREERRLTLEDVGDALSRTRAAVAFWESGKNQPPLHVLSKLADFFGVEPAFFFSSTITTNGNNRVSGR
jgi:transcriptional regulator with XRE-family HTH domain